MDQNPHCREESEPAPDVNQLLNEYKRKELLLWGFSLCLSAGGGGGGGMLVAQPSALLPAHVHLLPAHLPKATGVALVLPCIICSWIDGFDVLIKGSDTWQSQGIRFRGSAEQRER